MSERLDLLLSARLDHELTSDERIELDRLLVEHPEYATRARAFEDIDARLQALALQSTEREGASDDERWATNYAKLQVQLGLGESGSADSHSAGERRSQEGEKAICRNRVPLLLLFFLPPRRPSRCTSCFRPKGRRLSNRPSSLKPFPNSIPTP